MRPSSCVVLCAILSRAASLIDRRAVVGRHNVYLGLPIDADAVTSLGNGAFSFNVDVTGLQSLNSSYLPFDLNTLADWAWHSSFAGSDALQSYNFTTYNTSVAGGGTRQVRYPTGYNSSTASGTWLHNNPHKMPLAQIALAWKDNNELLVSSDVLNATQMMDAWTGSAESNSTLQGLQPDRTATNAHIFTVVHPDVDALAARVELSSRVGSRAVPLVLRIAFPYTTSGAADWSPAHDGDHVTTVIMNASGRFAVERTLDGDGYRVDCSFNTSWAMARGDSPHVLVLSAPSVGSDASTDLVCLFAPRNVDFPVGATTQWLTEKRSQTQQLQATCVFTSYDDVSTASAAAWAQYWQKGAFVDLAGASGSADAFELERRVVRSLYLLRALEAGAEPPAETGLLLSGGWAGKHHGEMRWWHQAWAPYWGRSEILSRSDSFYADYAPNATSVAAAQGYAGSRWPKMIATVANRSAGGVDVPWVGLEFAPLPSAVNGGVVAGLAPLLAWESSSGVGPLLIWQQSHSILLSEAQRRAAAASGGAAAALEVMTRLSEIVFATADFLASFAVSDAAGVFHLLPPLFGGEEGGNPDVISDPAFELVQINNALDTAAAWREAIGLPPVAAWEAVRGHLAAPPLDPATNSPPLYANNAACACLYTHGACAFPREGCPGPLTSHPMTSGLHGMLNALADDRGKRCGVTAESLNATTAAVLMNWTWGGVLSSEQVWGWDAPLLALSIARLGWTADSTIAALMLEFNKNLYNRQGVNQGMGNNTA